jgi:hypothetical protein
MSRLLILSADPSPLLRRFARERCSASAATDTLDVLPLLYDAHADALLLGDDVADDDALCLVASLREQPQWDDLFIILLRHDLTQAEHAGWECVSHTISMACTGSSATADDGGIFSAERAWLVAVAEAALASS